MLRRLRELGYEVGSGVMIGIPGQTCDDLADDLLSCSRELDLDMIGVGPYLAAPRHAAGPAASAARRPRASRCPTTS